MVKFASVFGHYIEDMLVYRESLGFSRITYEQVLSNLDMTCLLLFPNEKTLSKEIVMKWIERRPEESANTLKTRAAIIRYFAKYLNSVGVPAYVFPENFTPSKTRFTPYVFTDLELKKLFEQFDHAIATSHYPFKPYILPVLFRLIYTCGLRPNEGRELLCRNINLDTGEILITKTKHHKERLVVMSEDTLALCKKYDRIRTVIALESLYFFPAPNGKASTASWVNSEFKKAWQRANQEIPKEKLPSVRVYDLRHRFATAALHRWMDEGKDLYAFLPYLRAFMGHNELSSTAYYIHLLPENLVKSSGIDWASFSSLLPEVEVWPD